MLDDGLIKAGDTLEDIAPRISEARAGAGKAVGAIYDAADAAKIPGPTVAGIRDALTAKVLPDLEKLPELNKGATGAVKSALRDLEHFAGVGEGEDATLTFRQAQEIKSTLGKRINWKVNPFPTVEDKANDALKAVYHTIGGEIDSAGARAADQLGPNFGAELKAANARYQTYEALDRVAQNSSRLKEGRNIVGAGSKGLGAAAFAGMLAHGVASPLSAGMAAGTALMHHLVMERGAATTAAIINAVEQSTRGVTQGMEKGVAGFIARTGEAEAIKGRSAASEAYSAAKAVKRGGKLAERETTRQAYERRVATLQELQKPGVLAQRLAAHTAPLQSGMPKLAAALPTVAARGLAYLSGHLPVTGERDMLTGEKELPSGSEMAAFNLRYEVLERPEVVAEDLAKGRVTFEQVDALRSNFPEMYAELQGKAMVAVQDAAAAGKPLSLQQRTTLGVLMDIPTDPSLSKPAMGHASATFAAPPAQPPKGGGGSGGRNTESAAISTPEQKMTGSGL